jgi:exosome complex component RRP42|tara:strand:- start:4072 stop:4887 length:816 start_codon:yes stop_codon:yes gene_type:complete
MDIPNITKKKIRELLKDSNRVDGRAQFDNREIVVETDVSNKAEGSARVKLGNTEVIVGVKLQTQEPYSDHKDEGTLMVGMEINPSAGERYEPGPPKIDAIEIARVVDRGIRESGYIDFKKLCIKEGETVWSVMVDIYAINDDGNLLDASAIGAVAALKMTKIPEYTEEEGVQYGNLTDNGLPLTENESLMMTFYKVGNQLLFDPTRDEEDASSARLTLAISKPGKDKIINSMQKGGLDSMSIEHLNQVIEEAEKVYDKIFPELDKKVEGLK